MLSIIPAALTHIRLPGMWSAQTKSGAMRISQLTPAAITARTDNGAINVALAPRGGCDLDAQSESGKVSGIVPDSRDRLVEARRARRQVRGGGPRVDLDSRSSKITVN